MASAPQIGTGQCLNRYCKNANARFSLSKSQLVCATCDKCNLQSFARSGTSDEDLRRDIVPLPTASPVPVEIEPAPPINPEPLPPAEKRGGWGIFGS